MSTNVADLPTRSSNSAEAPLSVWREFFDGWPKSLKTKGVLGTAYDEQIPFCGFMLTEQFLLLERTMPDAIGARKVVVPLTNIVTIKFTDPIENQLLEEWGFAEAGDRRKADMAAL